MKNINVVNFHGFKKMNNGLIRPGIKRENSANMKHAFLFSIFTPLLCKG